MAAVLNRVRCRRILPILIVLVALAARLVPGPRTIDDAYITFRYTRNLLAGEGLVYNPGEAVLGTTTPLYAFLLAGAALFTGGPDAPFPVIAMVLNAVADAVTCLVLLRLGRRLGTELAGTGAALAWAVLPFSVTFAIGGLETSVVVLLMTGLAAAHIEGRRAWTGLLGSLALLARPDAALLLLPIGLDRIWLAIRKASRVTAPEAAAFALPLLAWFIPAALFYGSPIPHSVAAKAAAYALPPEAALTRLIQHYATPFMDNLSLGAAGIAAGLVFYPFLHLLSARRLIRTAPRAWPWLAFPWLWFAAYAIANPLIFRWYLTPPLPAYLFAILAGADFLRRDLTAGRLHRLKTPLAGLILAVPLALLLRGWTLSPDHGLDHPAPSMAWYELELKYREAADALGPIFAGQATPLVLAAADIGVLGYYTNAPILDTLGLVSPESSAYYPTRPEFYVNAYAVAPDLILDLMPDAIVLLEVYGRAGLFRDPRFQEAYELIHVVPTGIYDSQGMLIFRKR